MTTYDKVSWHFPYGENCESEEEAKGHFKALMRWLEEQDLLSEEGQVAMKAGVDSDFVITSYMLKPKGSRLLDICYKDWIGTAKYGVEPSMSVLEDCLRHL